MQVRAIVTAIFFCVFAGFHPWGPAFAALDDRLKNELFVDGDPVDHYSILGVDPKASVDDIKKAFRKRAMETHPDRNPALGTKPFQQVTRAYEVLSDDGKRGRFDRVRGEIMASAKARAKPEAPKAQGAKTGAQPKYEKWDPRTYHREAKQDSWDEFQWREQPKEAPKETPKAEPKAQTRTYSNFTQRPKPSALDRIPPELTTPDGKIWNYFAVAGVSGTAGPQKTEEAIRAKERILQWDWKTAKTEAERLDIESRLVRLRKAREVLTNPELKTRYFEYAKTVMVKDGPNGFRRSYYEILRDFVPTREAPPAAPSSCRTWFSRFL